jgi:hypothetical protein
LGVLIVKHGPAEKDYAERLTTRGLFKVDSEPVALSEREVVRGWLRELGQAGRDQQVMVHRPWGTVVAVPETRLRPTMADGRKPATVLMTDGEDTWCAVAPGAADDSYLEPDQVELILLDALASSGPPTWPRWRPI